jgi:hypothetical protein
VQILPTHDAQFAVVMNFLKGKGFGPDDTEWLEQQGYGMEALTKFLVDKGYCTAESAASSIVRNGEMDLGNLLKAVKKTDTTRPAVKNPGVKRKKKKDSALKPASTFKRPRPAKPTPADKSPQNTSSSIIPETQHEDHVSDAAAPSTIPETLNTLARVQQPVKAPKKTKTKAASMPPRGGKQTPLPVMTPNQKVNTLTSEQAGTCAFYKEYLKAAVHAIAPQDPPQQPFFYVGRGPHDACRRLTLRYCLPPQYTS